MEKVTIASLIGGEMSEREAKGQLCCSICDFDVVMRE